MREPHRLIAWKSAASRAVAGIFLILGLVVSSAAAVDWMALSAAEFAVRVELSEKIDPARFDAALLRTAIFHESNRIRRASGLKPFGHLPKLDDAADLKASVGVMQTELDHANPLPATAQPANRVEAVGLKYRRVGENLARLTIYAVRPGTTEIGLRQRGGEIELFDPVTKAPIHVNTYAGFAAAVVDAWMNSPGHRANLLHPDFTSLGLAVRPCVSPLNQQPQIYAVQVFFTPR